MLKRLQNSELAAKFRESRKFLIFIVYVALFLDNMLLTTVVPIIPEYLYHLEHPNETLGLRSEKVLQIPSLNEQMRDRVRRDTGHMKFDSRRHNNIRTNSSWKSDKIRSKRWPKSGWDEDPLIAKSFAKDYDEQREPVSSTTQSNLKPKQQNYEVRYRGDFHRDRSASTTTEDPQTKKERQDEQLRVENVQVGIMFGSKALLQFITNPFVGPLTARIGYTIPMFFGFVVMFFSTVLFAFGSSYAVLFIARTFQGIGSACTSTSGMGMIAQRYPDDKERGAAMGFALGGLALGVLVGPPYGGILYQWSGKELPFLILACLAVFDGGLQLIVLSPKLEKAEEEGSDLKELISDPYIIVAAGAITIGNLGIAMLEPTLPLWMMRTMKASSAERGAAFLPASISYLMGTNIFGPLAHRIGRWISTMIGLVVMGLSLLIIPSATSVYGLIIPNFFLGFAIGMIDASMFPQMGYLVDLRHGSVYGSIYAIADAAFCLAFALGPYCGAPMASHLGFPTMLYIIAAISILYAPLMWFLRNPPQITSEKEQLIPAGENGVGYSPFQDDTLSYVEVNQEGKDYDAAY